LKKTNALVDLATPAGVIANLFPAICGVTQAGVLRVLKSSGLSEVEQLEFCRSLKAGDVTFLIGKFDAGKEIGDRRVQELIDQRFPRKPAKVKVPVSA